MCLICERIAAIREGRNPHFVAELEASYVVLGDYQFFRGYTLLLAKDHAAEVHELPPHNRHRCLEEMSLVAEAVSNAFRPRKLNLECLGNAEPHVHWHIFPRYPDDPSPATTSWKVAKELRYAERHRPDSAQLAELKSALLREMLKLPTIARTIISRQQV